MLKDQVSGDLGERGGVRRPKHAESCARTYACCVAPLAPFLAPRSKLSFDLLWFGHPGSGVLFWSWMGSDILALAWTFWFGHCSGSDILVPLSLVLGPRKESKEYVPKRLRGKLKVNNPHWPTVTKVGQGSRVAQEEVREKQKNRPRDCLLYLPISSPPLPDHRPVD